MQLIGDWYVEINHLLRLYFTIADEYRGLATAENRYDVLSMAIFYYRSSISILDTWRKHLLEKSERLTMSKIDSNVSNKNNLIAPHMSNEEKSYSVYENLVRTEIKLCSCHGKVGDAEQIVDHCEKVLSFANNIEEGTNFTKLFLREMLKLATEMLEFPETLKYEILEFRKNKPK